MARSKKSFVIDGATYVLYSIAWRSFRMLPKDTAYQFAELFCRYLVKRNIKQVRRLRSNLARVKPELSSENLEELVKAGMESYMRYWCDTFRFSDWDKTSIQKNVEVIHGEYFYEPLNSGKGLIVSLPHAGNWDHAGAYFCSQGYELVTVAEHLKPDRLFRKFLAHRQRMGMEVLDLDNRVSAILAQRLRAGKLVALVADRDLSQSGIDVKFFDGIARMPAGPAVLALQTGVSLITAFTSYTDNGLRIEFDKPIPIPHGAREEQIRLMTQECADRFASHISLHPTDWHMLQRIWVDGDFRERTMSTE